MVAGWEWGLISLCALGTGLDEKAWIGGPGCRDPQERGTSSNELNYTVDYSTLQDAMCPWAMGMELEACYGPGRGYQL